MNSNIISSLSSFLDNTDISHFSNVPESLKPFLIQYLFHKKKQSIILIVPEQKLVYEYHTFLKNHHIESHILPFYDLLPYEEGLSSPPLLHQRMQTLFYITQKKTAVYLTSLKNLLFPTIPYSCFSEQHQFTIKVNTSIKRSFITEKLVTWGYTKLPYIESEGQFSVRGEVIDIFSPSYPDPIRITFFDDTPEKIQPFSLSNKSQSHSSLQSIEILSIHDFIFDEEKKEQFHLFLKKEFGPEKIDNFFSLDHSFNIHLAPFFYKNYHLFEFFKESQHPFQAIFDNPEQLISQEKITIRDIKELYLGSFNVRKIMLHPSTYFLKLESILTDESLSQALHLHSLNSSNNHDSEVFCSFLGRYQLNTSYQGRVELLNQHLEYEYKEYNILLIAQNEIQLKKLEALFPNLEVTEQQYWNEGFTDIKNKTLYLTYTDIFGKKTKALNTGFMLKNTSPIENFSEMSHGDFIVHIQHGIGIFDKIEQVSILGKQKDYIKIIYADEESLYIPIEQINLVHKYLGSDNPKLNNLGGKKWEQKKARAAKKMEEMSEELAILYESRKQLKGFQFPEDIPFQTQFEEQFPFEETEGQLQAIEDVKKDMQSPFIMDRLICGDVGYGKTEVAMRAVFKAVCAGKQVAIIAPTVLLVEQHYQSFLKRFEHFPVNIAMLSRLVSASNKKRILEDLKKGSIDIVIGSHALLSASVQFKDLGLFIIDEEQRFGVKHKEKLKQIKNDVDALTLSATPIPRTLYMGISQIRDMSLITTPPSVRLSIKTYVMPFKENVLKTAIERELERQGQIFIIHNRVKTIENFRNFIQKIHPSARVLVGHGQMSADEMESIFLSFLNHEADILISTTIIENGIDIPNTNTIIIDKPELLGLSELYQLRGRVGRGKRQGYAYLFYDAVQGLSQSMQKRLETIEENSQLGSGFKIAMRDLEIRGAGNLLGKDQSGIFEDIGIELYTKMLKQALKKIQGQLKEDTEVTLDLPFHGYIPETYISSESERFAIYKNLMQAKDDHFITELCKNLEPSYGKIPETMYNLITIAHIKILAKILDIKEIKYEDQQYIIYFQGKPNIQTDLIMPLIQKSKIQILNTESFSIKEGTFKENTNFLQEIEMALRYFTPKPSESTK